jgi:hypothetical protein
VHIHTALQPTHQQLAQRYLQRDLLLGLLIAFVVFFIMRGFIFRRYDPAENLIALVASSAFSALIFTAVIGFVTRSAYRNLFDVAYNSRARVDQVRRVQVSLPYHIAFDRCMDALSVLGNHHVLLQDRSQGRIEAVRVTTLMWQVLWASQGERISIRLGSDKEGVTEIEVASRSPMSTAVFGAGKHKKNVERIINFLTSVERNGTTK